MRMGPVNWIAVILAANLAVAVGIVWHGPLFRTGRPLLEGPGGRGKSYLATVIVMLLGAVMLGHNFARIGAVTLGAKPWLYLMMSGGVALFFIAPALWLAAARQGVAARQRAVDAGFWVAAYLSMGLVFWALG
jgi:hypothetical protein